MSQATTSIYSRLTDLVGAEYVASDVGFLAPYKVDGVMPQAALRPGSAAEVAEILRFASAEGLAVMAMGGRSKLGIGMPPRKYDLALDMTRMNRVAAYDPGDLTLGVEPGVRYAELERVLGAERQFLPLAPAFAERATMGGIVATGGDSPLRHGYGGLRDFLLGMEFVTGAGVISKSGGRVVKNVTGYDTHKLLAGSLGTLAVITRINFRTFPKPPEQRVFVLSCADAAGALSFCAGVARTQLQPRMVEAFNGDTARQMGIGGAENGGWYVAIAAAGESAAVARHARELAALAREAGTSQFEILDEAPGAALITAISEFPRLAAEVFPESIIFRVAVLPSEITVLIKQVETTARRHECGVSILVRAAGIVYAALAPSQASAGARLAACNEVIEAGTSAGGHPMIEWCPANVKREMNVWPPAGDTRMVAQRLKSVFDPAGIMAPGRFMGGL